MALDAWLRDLRYAIRSLFRTPVFSITVILTLALGIGANSAVFSALDAVLLRPLPFPDGDRLMELRQRVNETSESNIAPVRLEDWRRSNDTFAAITGYYTEDISETSGEFPVRIKRALVAPRFLDVWRVEPMLGRGFTPAEHRVGGPQAVLVSYRYWRDRLGSDPHALTRSVRIRAAAVPIIGVMPETFLFPDRSVDVWSAIAIDSKIAQSRALTWYQGVGRLKTGVTIEQARANLAAVQSQLARQHGDPDSRISVVVAPLKDVGVAGVRRSLWLLFGGVSVLLLIACTNIAALLLTRGAHRQHELAIRLSLGASPFAVARQLLVETAVLSFAGAACGLLVAVAGIRLLQSADVNLPRLDEIAVDWRIVLYTVSIALVAAVLCAILPVVRVVGTRATPGLSEGGRTFVSSRASVQRLLVGAQIALSVMLLVGAGLLARSFQELWRTDAGFNLSQVLAFRVSGNWAETANLERLAGRIDTTLERLRALPGVEHAATTGWSLPGVPTEYENTFAFRGAQGDAERGIVAEARSVSPEYFATMQIPVSAGQLCSRRGRSGESVPLVREAMVNRTFAEQYFAGSPASAIGVELTQANSRVISRIAGIVGDARERGLDRPPGPILYWCNSAPNPTPYFLVRTRTQPAALAQTLRITLKELEPLRAIYDLGVLEERVGSAFADNRLRAVLLAAFAATALVLASVGMYGTMSYIVRLRRREVALRLALGALSTGVIRQFWLEGARIVVLACVVGAGVSYAAARLLSGMLYGVSPNDLMAWMTALGVVAGIGSVAAFIPALRASRLPAAEVLRE